MLEKFTWRKKKKPFSAWQIELTTRCPLLCKMCIRSERNDWHYHDMPLEDFKKISPYLKDVQNVVLEGWGESLLHPNLVDCIQLVKREGPEVGFVTSGKGLTQDRASELVRAGLDFVGFSLAGTTAETHDAIRVNSRLPEIVDAIHSIREEKARQSRHLPRMHIVFLMVKDNIHEVPALPAFAKETGIEEVVLVNICHSINAWQEKQRVFSYGEGDDEFEKMIRRAESDARKLNIKLRRPSLSAMDVPVCGEDPLRNLYISTDGEVSPCVFLYPPINSPFKRIFSGKEYWLGRVGFGNIFRESFPRIWENKNYVQFRNCFVQRRKRFRELDQLVWNSIRPLDSQNIDLPEPPEPCMTCHKMLSL